MQFYLAPMEGLTGYVYRNAYHKYFPAADRYFTPFITNKKMSSRERNDILPEHNEGMTVIPQILTNQAEDFLSLTKELREYGYDARPARLSPSGAAPGCSRGRIRSTRFSMRFFRRATAASRSKRGLAQRIPTSGRICLRFTTNIRSRN